MSSSCSSSSLLLSLFLQGGEDVLAHIVSYADFASAVRFAEFLQERQEQDTARQSSLYRKNGLLILQSQQDDDNEETLLSSTSSRIGLADAFANLWKDMFHRQGFSNPYHRQDDEEATETTTDYVLQAQYRRQLLRNLLCKPSSHAGLGNEKAPSATLARYNKTPQVGVGKKTPKQQEAQDNHKNKNINTTPPKKKQLKSNKRGESSRPKFSCFHLPNRFFRFIPVMPPDWEEDLWNNNMMMTDSFHDPDDEEEDEHYHHAHEPHHERPYHHQHPPPHLDPPPVDFECDSFVLTCTGAGSEWLFLNPFSGQLCVHRSVLDHAVGRSSEEEGMLEQALQGAATQRSVPQRNHHAACHRQPPQQILLDVQDFFDVDLADYFYEGAVNNNHSRRRTPVPVDPSVEVEIAFLGVESKPMVAPLMKQRGDGTLQSSLPPPALKVTGNMVAIGRSLWNDPEDWQDSLQCVEILAWFRRHHSGDNKDSPTVSSPSSSSVAKIEEEETAETADPLLYGDRHVCRVRGGFHTVDLCPLMKRFYVNPLHTNNNSNAAGAAGVAAAPLMNQAPPHPQQQQQGWANMGGASFIEVYPLVPLQSPRAPSGEEETADAPASEDDNRRKSDNHDEANSESQQPRPDMYFPQPEFVLDCGAGARIATLNVTPTGDQLLVATIQHQLLVWSIPTTETNHTRKEACPLLLASISISGAVEKAFSMTHHFESGAMRGRVPIFSMHFPKHLHIDMAGFVTLQHEVTEGNVLLLWQRQRQGTDRDMDESNPYEVQSMIKLPLLARRIPKIHYDGRRLIVFGEDHIGFIILVYHVSHPSMDPVVEVDVDDDEDEKEEPRVAAADTSYGKTNEEVPSPVPPQPPRAEEESGGVYNRHASATNAKPSFSSQSVVEFANRIRHVGLGGIASYDSLHMTCNERFLVINTKMGNHLSGGSLPYSEGLLVIDLEDDRCHNAC